MSRTPSTSDANTGGGRIVPIERSVVEFPSREHLDNESAGKYERRLSAKAFEAFQSVWAAVPNSSTLRPLIDAARHAQWRVAWFWERRSLKLEAQLRRVLSADVFTDPVERAAVLKTLYRGGEQSRTRCRRPVRV